jgi:D-aminopeptidase
MAQSGLARAIYPVHAARRRGVRRRDRPHASDDPLLGLAELSSVGANVVARAVARAVYEARALPFPSALPSWRDRYSPRLLD